MDREPFLKSLVQQIKSTQPRTLDRARLLNKLIREIQTFGHFYGNSHPSYSEIWNTSLQVFCNKIDDFEVKGESVEGSIRSFINAILHNKFRNLNHKDRKAPRSLDEPLFGTEGELSLLDLTPLTQGPERSLSLLDQLIAREQASADSRLAILLNEYVRTDPKSQLQQCQLRRNPEIHAQMLTLRLWLKEPPEKMLHISREYGVNNPTVAEHWKRRCIPMLREIVQELKKNMPATFENDKP